jgi:hypothetical protein
VTDQEVETTVVHIPGLNVQVPTAAGPRQIQRCAVCGVAVWTSEADAGAHRLVGANGQPITTDADRSYAVGVPCRFTGSGRGAPIAPPLPADFCGFVPEADPEL